MNRIKFLSYAIAAILVVALGSLLLLHSQSASAARKTEKKISWTITLPDGNWVNSRESEGGMLRIERDGKIWGFTPIVRDEAKGSIAVKVFQITKTDNGVEAIKEIESQKVGMASARRLDTDGFSVQVTKIEQVALGTGFSSEGEPGDVPIDEPGEGVGKCCVTCNGWKVCGCKVEMSCGSCCSDACCT